MIAHAKEVRDDGAIVEIVIWALPEPLRPCLHNYKYRLYFGRGGECFVRYDNERGKGDHKHRGRHEEVYEFIGIKQLLADFQADVEELK